MRLERQTVGGISYADVGNGPVTLFVHGVFTNADLWRGCVRLLSGHRRCIAIDLPGHGETPPTGEPTVWGLADAVSTLVRELDLRDIALVGNDTGGAVAQIVLTRFPDRISSFALTNCDTEGNFPPRWFAPVVHAARLGLLRYSGPLARFPALARQVYRTGYQHVAGVPDEVIKGYTACIATPEGRRFMGRLLASMNPYLLARIRPLLQKCEIPTLLVWGTGDIFFKLEWAHWLRRLIPGAREIVEVPGGRLFYVDERAPELVAALEKHW